MHGSRRGHTYIYIYIYIPEVARRTDESGWIQYHFGNQQDCAKQCWQKTHETRYENMTLAMFWVPMLCFTCIHIRNLSMTWGVIDGKTCSYHKSCFYNWKKPSSISSPLSFHTFFCWLCREFLTSEIFVWRHGLSSITFAFTILPTQISHGEHEKSTSLSQS